VLWQGGCTPPCFALFPCLRLEPPTKHSPAWLLRDRVQAIAEMPAQVRRQEHKQTLAQGWGLGRVGLRAAMRGVSS
jgi:hypothetical protein